jgi:two-component system, sensor histidine kinase
VRRVLVVDDNHDAASLLGVMLEMWECTVVVAHDGATAIALAEADRFDLALVDIGLPVMDGWEVGRKLRAIDPLLRLVALTGHAGETPERASRDAGFADHLVKPVDMDVLQRVVTSVPGR